MDRDSDMDGDGDCRYFAAIISGAGATGAPPGNTSAEVSCGGNSTEGWVAIDTIEPQGVLG